VPLLDWCAGVLDAVLLPAPAETLRTATT
jgi:hypothetical protein